MAQSNLTPAQIAEIQRQIASRSNGPRYATLDGYIYAPEYESYTGSGFGDGGDGVAFNTPNGPLATFVKYRQGDDTGQAFNANGTFQGQRDMRNSALLKDLAKFGAAAAGVYGLGTLASGAMGAGLGGATGAAGGADAATSAAWQGGAGLGGDTLSAMGLGGTEAGAATGLAAATPELGTTGVNAMRAGEIAGYSTNGTLTPAAVAANGSGLSNSGTGLAAGVKDGWDTLNAITSTPVGKLVTGVVGTALAGEAANALTPNPDTAKISQLVDGMLADQNTARSRSQNLWDDYLNTWRPIEQKYAQTALGYDTPQRREDAALAASTDVAGQYDKARTAYEQQAIQSGVDPSTIATMGLSSRVTQAKDEANAMNGARTGVESRGMQYLQNAAQFGRGLSGDSRSESQVSQNASNSAISAQNGLNNTNLQTANSRNAIFGDILGAGANLLGRTQATTPTGTKNWWESSLWGG